MAIGSGSAVVIGIIASMAWCSMASGCPGSSDFTASVSGGDQTMTLDATVPTIAGGFVGAGFETKLTKSISLKGEYRFTEFGSGLVTLPNVGGTDLNQFVSARVSPTLQIVKASVNHRFRMPRERRVTPASKNSSRIAQIKP